MLPYFYHPALDKQQKMTTLDEPTSKHCIQVLRMQEGEQMLLTDGKGLKATVTIVSAERKRCGVRLDQIVEIPKRPFSLTMAISFTKNNSRNEWLLEKCTEMGIDRIIPLVTARTEKDKFNEQRLTGILVSAMLQSQQCHLPVLEQPTALKTSFFDMTRAAEQKMIAHCIEDQERRPLPDTLQRGKDTVILIGPEGDFTESEIAAALENDYKPVVLGPNRLRTETAGLYVCTVFNAMNYA